MEDRIYEIIKPWAGVSTWYTGHPLDQQRFHQVMVNLVSELGCQITIDEFEAALRRHVESNPAVLGQPGHWDELIKSYLIKAEFILDYEREK